MQSQQNCLQLWIDIDNRLPFNGTQPYACHMQGNWSCWSHGRHVFGSKGMDCWQVVDFVTAVAKPKSILEIGFNAGHSACMWLSRTDANVTSVDIEFGLCHKLGSEYLTEKFPDRFKFIQCDSTKLYEQIKDNQYDLVVVDGGHCTDICLSDCYLSLKLGAKYLVVDDVIVAESVKNGVDQFVAENSDKVKLINKWNVAWGVALYEISP
jgi:predicted O-methyltransferase YrrM